MSNNNKLILGLLLGAVAGAGLALLLAPGKGDETRQKISDAAGDLTDKIMRKAEEMVSSLKDHEDVSPKSDQYS